MGSGQGKMASPGVFELEAELESLQRRLRRLRAIISDAEKMQAEGEVFALWLREIKDIACDAEDLIDEFEYEELRRQIEGNGSSGGLASSLSQEAMIHKMKEVRQKMHDILDEKNALRFGDASGLGDQEGTQTNGMQTGSLLKGGEVLGREREEEEIIEFLLTSDDEVTPSTIAITGMGGLGKTTLAQLVYNDSRVEEHFHLKMWVCVAAGYDVVKVTREILGATGYDMQRLWGLENLDVYQRMLVDKLKGQRFLLVIDNLWRQDCRKWQTILAPLIYEDKGSKVLITTRDQQVARNLQATKTVELGGLQFYDCWRLFVKHALPHGNFEEHPRLEAIGLQIVDKFKGVPLAAVVMGGSLHSEFEDVWMGILESKVWEKGDEDGGILSVLKLSYDHLPSHLKQCFAYCSIFPKNYKFDRLELVHLWMAQGFVQTRGRKRMEDVGTEYFNDLLDRSFFQFVDGKFAIHDLMLDLAQLVSHCDQSILEIEGSPPETFLEDAYQLRHLSLSINSTQLNRTSLEGLCRCRGLRTLAFNFHRSIKFQIPRDLFLRLNMLRVLDLSFGGLETLPDSVGILVHLRYLDLRGNNFTRLPESLCHLHLLQTLRLKGCDHINKLPQGFSNLINLRHLEAEPHLLSQVVGFGKLTCLQELASFPISKRNGIKIEDLKDMNELRGMIRIRNLQWVSGKEEATQAMLSSKRYLRKLEMSWDGHVGRFELEEEILGALVPPSGLEELSIKCYDGLKFPSWMEQPSLAMLESLCLSQWRNLNSLPLLWQRLPFLKTIELVGCPQLRYLPPLSTALRGLTIDDVGLEELPDFYQPSDESFENSTPSLSILSIKSCPALTSLKQGLLRCHLRHLTVLSIQDCRQLAEWPEGDEFRATLLSVQKELRLSGCPKLKALPAGSTLSASLEKVSVIDCPSVVDGSLFAHLQEVATQSIVCVGNTYAKLKSKRSRKRRSKLAFLFRSADSEYSYVESTYPLMIPLLLSNPLGGREGLAGTTGGS